MGYQHVAKRLLTRIGCQQPKHSADKMPGHKLMPKTYFEIGTLHGDTLALARCASLAVDPEFRLNKPEIFDQIVNKPKLMLFQMASDDFFAQTDPERLLGA